MRKLFQPPFKRFVLSCEGWSRQGLIVAERLDAALVVGLWRRRSISAIKCWTQSEEPTTSFRTSLAPPYMRCTRLSAHKRAIGDSCMYP
jgi:hypothetical protein